ncbi:MAG: phosphoribosyltransferase family protein [Candidatus Gastranaerophilales bacterium]|nr:phosphoribosyltransferase family protein [Candidatus Gastranaerophilales bacterium]
MDKTGFYYSREEAGSILAEKIMELDLKKPCLLAIPRGGIQVAKGVADKLEIPIYPVIVKKLPIPGNPEAGFGAITEDGIKVLDEKTIAYLDIDEESIERISQNVVREVIHRSSVYGSADRELVKSSDAIIVDDGVATGYSLIAAIKSVKGMNPSSITAAVPVASKEAYKKIQSLVDNFICPLVDETYFFAVANYYKQWFDLEENKIIEILKVYREKYKK